MAMIDCHECGKQISEGAGLCPNCGAKPKKFKWWLWYPLGGVATFFLIGIFSNSNSSPEAKEKNRAREAISICWKDYESKSFDPATKRFVAGACEMMEQKFKDKYHDTP